MNFVLLHFCHLKIETIFVISNIQKRYAAVIFQQQLKHVAEPLSRHILPRYPVELPKLNVGVPTPKVPYPVSSLPALAIPHKGLPAITSKMCHSRSMKVNAYCMFRIFWVSG